MTILKDLLDGEPFKFKDGFICYCCSISDIFIKNKYEFNNITNITIHCYNCKISYMYPSHEIDTLRYIVI